MSVVGMAFNYGLACIDGKAKVWLQDMRRWVHNVPGWCEAIECKPMAYFATCMGLLAL
jgi:hypothetical protein